MKRWIWVGCLLGSGMWGVRAQAPGPSVPPAPSLCTRLAAEMREAPASHWASSDPLSRWVVRAEGGSPFAETLSSDPVWLAELGLESDRRLSVSHLRQAQLHLIEEVGGTANCQAFVALARAQAGQVPRRLALPFELDLKNLCTTRSADLALVLGEPAFMVGGAPSMTSPEREYRLAPWTGEAWGSSCSLRWTERTAIRPGQHFCAEGKEKLCAAGQALALRLAKAYEAAPAPRQNQGWAHFAGPQVPSKPMLDFMHRLFTQPPEPDSIGADNPPFPLVGPTDGNSLSLLNFSNADLLRVPVKLQGRWWLALVGRAGIGWRQTDAVLVSLFAPPGRMADAVASYQFLVKTTGLQRVSASGD